MTVTETEANYKVQLRTKRPEGGWTDWTSVRGQLLHQSWPIAYGLFESFGSVSADGLTEYRLVNVNAPVEEEAGDTGVIRILENQEDLDDVWWESVIVAQVKGKREAIQYYGMGTWRRFGKKRIYNTAELGITFPMELVWEDVPDGI